MLAAVLAACASDPTLHVEVKNPSGLSIAKTVVSIYESSTLSCQAIEYGDVSDAELSGALVASETLVAMGPTQGSLDNLSRTDPKFVVARAYTAGGELAAAGCAEKDEVVGADSVTVQTEPAALVSIVPSTEDSGLAVSVADVTGKPIANRQVWWRVDAAVGAHPAMTTGVTNEIDGAMQDTAWQADGPLCTDGSGTQTVHPIPPDIVGGYEIRVRVAWPAEPIPGFSAVTHTQIGLTTFDAPAGIDRVCALGRDATGPHEICLQHPSLTDPSIVAEDYAIAGDGTVTASQLPASFQVPPIALYAAPDGSNTGVYAAFSRGAPMEVFPATRTLPCTGCSALTAKFDDVLVAPACGGSAAALLLHDASVNKILVMSVAGGALVDLPGEQQFKNMANIADLLLNSAGCATWLDPSTGVPTVEQVVVIDLAKKLGIPAATAAVFACGSSACGAPLPLPGAEVGFTGGTTPEIVVPSIDASGVVLTTDLLGTTGTLLETSRQPAASLPQTIVSGNFDKDTTPDLALDVDTARVGALLGVDYAHLVDDQPLAALSPALHDTNGDPIAVTNLTPTDLNGDGVDDLVLVGHTVVGPGSANVSTAGFGIIRLGIPETYGSLTVDKSNCAP